MEKIKTEPMLSTYLHAKGRHLGLPIGGNFELTARCNFHCPMCYVHLNGPDVADRELTAAQWIDLARQARDAGTVFALITGGEPFIRRDFFEIYSAMKAMGLMVSINTNGSLLRGRVLEQLLADPPFRVNISLYGGCEATYRSMCGQDAFAQVVAAIRALRTAGIDVRLNLSITPYNLEDLSDIFRISRELDVHIKGTSYMFPPIRVGDSIIGSRLTAREAAQASVQWDGLRLSPEEFARRSQSMAALTAAPDRECPVETDEGVSCRAGSSSYWVTWDGRMLPCGMMPGPTAYPLETDFRTAWQYILEQTKAIRTPSQCAGCSKRGICPVCAASCVAETGSFDRAPEYLCQFTDGLIEAYTKG